MWSTETTIPALLSWGLQWVTSQSRMPIKAEANHNAWMQHRLFVFYLALCSSRSSSTCGEMRRQRAEEYYSPARRRRCLGQWCRRRSKKASLAIGKGKATPFFQVSLSQSKTPLVALVACRRLTTKGRGKLPFRTRMHSCSGFSTANNSNICIGQSISVGVCRVWCRCSSFAMFVCAASDVAHPCVCHRIWMYVLLRLLSACCCWWWLVGGARMHTRQLTPPVVCGRVEMCADNSSF